MDRNEVENCKTADAAQFDRQYERRRYTDGVGGSLRATAGEMAGTMAAAAGLGGATPAPYERRSRPVTLENVDRVFTYQSPNSLQLQQLEMVRDASLTLAKTILRCVPDCADRSAALRSLRECRMWANAAIALAGEV